jgi:hypothetical protein
VAWKARTESPRDKGEVRRVGALLAAIVPMTAVLLLAATPARADAPLPPPHVTPLSHEAEDEYEVE